MNKIKFVQIGTSIANDDVYELVKDNDIELGVLVEPLIEYEQQIKDCYHGIDNIYLEQVAISTTGVTELSFYTSKVHKGIGSFNRNHLVDHHIANDDIEQRTVKCMHISELFEKYAIDTLDYLFIDAEGFDADIIMSIDLFKYKIRNIIFEDIHIDAPKYSGGPKTVQLANYLRSYGYTFTKTHKWNTTATLEHIVTTCISTNNNLEYLKLAIESVRKNAFFKNQPIIVYAENCTDGTNEWLEQNAKTLQLTVCMENNTPSKGIGGGMNICVAKAETEFVNIIHSDMWIAPNQDLELLRLYDKLDKSVRLIASSFRIQPKIFDTDPDYRPGTIFVPLDEFGAYHNDFDHVYFDKWASDFSSMNNIAVRKGGGAGFFCRKEDYVYIGGNDPLFAPASWEDMDLFIRMQLEGYEFKMTSKSVVYHFSARGSHFRDEAKDKLDSKSERQQISEQVNIQKFIMKWGSLPEHDEQTFVKAIVNKNVITKLDFYQNI